MTQATLTSTTGAQAHARKPGLLARVPWRATVSPLVVLCCWELVCRLGWIEPQLLPAPSAIVARMVQLGAEAEFWQHFGITMYRLLAGLLIAIVVGVGLGLCARLSRVAAAFLNAAVRLLAPIPKIALYPAFLLVLGFENASKVALIVADALFPVLMATWAATSAVDRKLIWSARAAGTGRAACLWKVILPASLPTILAGIRVAGVIACVVVFLAEMIGSTDGLGHMLTVAARAYRTLDMFVPLAWICLLGLMLNCAIGYVQRCINRAGR